MPDLRTSPPPPDAELLRSWELTSPAHLRTLRADLVAAIHECAPDLDGDLDEVPERVILVATELATNALKHGLPPTTVRLLRAGGRFVLDVADHDLTQFPELADTRPVNAGGRGLHLALAFSLEVGWYATAETKHIWATFPATP
ncbi:ATP-binding protein [Catenuloplanes indicus]|uniref:Histidine kinase/HSP90-like ATPase domain-containing protein n=1 Tax=Catenuloplanes indicus TaxID=137267 RepID=A0AAE3VV25_9ACTN|nr:ATP-binding protein [Catenuloplanes indicus]MDQ0364356.1 hypothetical protein [Catenuloplanes indicus]